MPTGDAPRPRRSAIPGVAASGLALLLVGCAGQNRYPPPLPTPRPDLRIVLTNVAWTQTGGSTTSGTFRKTGAVVDLWCRPPRLVLTTEGAAVRRGSPDARAVCGAIASSPVLLRPGSPPRCAGSGYWAGGVLVEGRWRGRTVRRDLRTCRQIGTGALDDAQRWAQLLGMAFVGPDAAFAPPA